MVDTNISSRTDPLTKTLLSKEFFTKQYDDDREFNVQQAAEEEAKERGLTGKEAEQFKEQVLREFSNRADARKYKRASDASTEATKATLQSKTADFDIKSAEETAEADKEGGPLAGANNLTKLLLSKQEFQQKDSQEKDEFIDYFFDKRVEDIAKKEGLSQEEVKQFKDDIKQEVNLWESTQGIRQSFNPVTGALTAATTGGLSTALRGFGTKAALKTAGYAGGAALPTEYAAGALSEPLYEKSPALGMATELGLGVGLGLTTERIMERGLRKGVGKLADNVTGNYADYAEDAASRVSKSPNIFEEGTSGDIVKQTQDLVEKSSPEDLTRKASEIQKDLDNLSNQYAKAESPEEKARLKREIDNKTSQLEEIRRAEHGEPSSAEEIKSRMGGRTEAERKTSVAARSAQKMKQVETEREQLKKIKGTKTTGTEQLNISDELEPGVTVRKDGRPYGSLNEVNKALKRKGMVETHEPKQLGENQWGFVAKTEKPTPEQQSTMKEKP